MKLICELVDKLFINKFSTLLNFNFHTFTKNGNNINLQTITGAFSILGVLSLLQRNRNRN